MPERNRTTITLTIWHDPGERIPRAVTLALRDVLRAILRAVGLDGVAVTLDHEEASS